MRLCAPPSGERSQATAAREVGLDRRRVGLRHVLHVGEVVVALADAGGAAEVVDRDGGVAALGEAQGELLVEAVEPAHVGQDDDADRRGRVGRAAKAAKRVPSAEREHEVLCETAAPAISGMGGEESSSKHM